MRLVVLIPAYNEESTIGDVIAEIPKSIPHVTEISVVVIDDGSTDGTEQTARDAGAIVYSFEKNNGLARAVSFGFSKCLELKADIMVTLDADDQYDPAQIPVVLKPIIDNKADIVLGDRQVHRLEHMPLQKRIGNRLVSETVSRIIRKRISDAQTGFRAFNSHALASLHIFSRYTYTQETLLQASFKGLTIAEVPVEFRKRRVGKSKLVSNIFTYAIETAYLITSTVIFYKSVRFFGIIAVILFVLGIGLSAFLLAHFGATGQIRPHHPTMILASLFLITASMSSLMIIISSILNRQSVLQEEILYKLREKISEK